MLTEMRQRFIRAAMMAITLVMTLLIVAINVGNYMQIMMHRDMTADNLMKEEVLYYFGADVENLDALPMHLQEGERAIHHFSLIFSEDGTPERVSTEDANDVSEEDALEFGINALTESKVLNKDHTRNTKYHPIGEILHDKQMTYGRIIHRGYENRYRYSILVREDKIFVLFLDVHYTQQSFWTLLIVSIFMALVSAIIVFLLIIVFSKRAIRPYERNIARQKQFITNASHELKTPITSIAMSADIASMEHKDDEWIANIQKQTLRIKKLIEDMTLLSQIDERGFFGEKEVISISGIVWEMCDLFRAPMNAKGKRFEQEIEENLQINGNREGIQTLLSVLLENALKYSEEGGLVRITLSSQKGKCILEVYNTCDLENVGDMSRVFERFYRLEESRASSTGGTGIGLSIASAIVDLHRGTISADSEDGKSFCIHVMLPMT